MSTKIPAQLIHPGHVVQVVYQQFPILFSTSSAIPHDNSIPQITEGAEFASLAITPKSATSRLSVEAVLPSNVAFETAFIAALFRDAIADAFAAINYLFIVNSNGLAHGIGIVQGEVVSGSTSQTTFRVRIGYGATPTTVRVNSDAGGVQVFNGKSGAFIRITEIAA